MGPSECILEWWQCRNTSHFPDLKNWNLAIRCSLVWYQRHSLCKMSCTSLQGIQSMYSKPFQQRLSDNKKGSCFMKSHLPTGIFFYFSWCCSIYYTWQELKKRSTKTYWQHQEYQRKIQLSENICNMRKTGYMKMFHHRILKQLIANRMISLKVRNFISKETNFVPKICKTLIRYHT